MFKKGEFLFNYQGCNWFTSWVYKSISKVYPNAFQLGLFCRNRIRILLSFPCDLDNINRSETFRSIKGQAFSFNRSLHHLFLQAFWTCALFDALSTDFSYFSCLLGLVSRKHLMYGNRLSQKFHTCSLNFMKTCSHHFSVHPDFGRCPFWKATLHRRPWNPQRRPSADQKRRVRSGR